jgi:hypothetical protein
MTRGPVLEEVRVRRYVVALGGELELVAVFGDRKIILTGSCARRGSAVQQAVAPDGSTN